MSSKLAYGVGQVAEGVKTAGFSTFLLLFYNQVLGVPGSLAGIAVFVALCFDAVTDPIAGSVSDNFRSKWGRRHPFMYASAVPLGVAFHFLFTPPLGWSEPATFAWLVFFAVATRGAMTLYHVPHLALGAELSDDYAERTRVVAIRQVFAVLGTLAVSVLSYSLFFRDVGGVPGDLEYGNYYGFAVTMGVVMTVTILLSAIGTHGEIKHLPPTRFIERRGVGVILAGVWTDFREAIGNSSFKWLAAATLCSYVMVGLQNALTLYMANFFWELDDHLKGWLLAAGPIGYAGGIPVILWLQHRMEKQQAMMLGAAVYAGFVVGPVVLRLAGVFPENGSTWLAPLLVVANAIGGMGGVQTVITANSMMADVADEHELETRRRQEGIFFGAVSFSGKAASGVGSMIGGFALDWIQFPTGAVPGEVAPEIVFRLGAVFGPSLVVLALASLWLISHYDLPRERHAEILRKLQAARED